MLVRKLSHTGGESPVQSVGVACAAVVSFAGARGRCVGCDWRGHRLLRNGALLRQIARAVWGPDWGVPTGAGKIGLDGAGDYESAITRIASYTHDGGGHGTASADFAGEEEQRLDGARMRAQGARHPGCRGHHRSLFCDPAPHEP